MIFKKFDERARELLSEFLVGFDYVGSDFSYYASLQWHEVLEYAVEQNALFLRGDLEGRIYYFPPLLKQGGAVKTMKEAAALLRANVQSDVNIAFAFCTEDFAREMMKDGYAVTPRRDWAEYIYKAEDFISLKGKRYHSKRNHISNFTEKYSFEYRAFEERDFAAVRRFEEKWLCKHTAGQGAQNLSLAMEENIIVDGWLRAALQGELFADVIYIDGEIAGVEIGELMPSGNGVAMYEKADIAFEGIYSFIAHEFSLRHFSNCKYICRQEDMDIEGLRKSKMSYYPEFLLMKYFLVEQDDKITLRNHGYDAPCTLSVGEERKALLQEKYTFSQLFEKDFDMLSAFYARGIDMLENKLFFLNFTHDELRDVLQNGYVLGAFFEGRLVSVCALDFDKAYGDKLGRLCNDKTGLQHYEFSGIMTDAGHRGAGLSNYICLEVADFARQNLSPCMLTAVVQWDNFASLGNLTKQGFLAASTVQSDPYTFTYLRKMI